MFFNINGTDLNIIGCFKMVIYVDFKSAFSFQMHEGTVKYLQAFQYLFCYSTAKSAVFFFW